MITFNYCGTAKKSVPYGIPSVFTFSRNYSQTDPDIGVESYSVKGMHKKKIIFSLGVICTETAKFSANGTVWLKNCVVKISLHGKFSKERKRQPVRIL